MTKKRETKSDFKPRPIYTPEEIGEIVSVTGLTVRKWIRQGRLKGIKIERFVRVTHDEMLRVCREGLLPPREKEGKK